MCSLIFDIENYVQPCFSFLARYWQDPMDDISASSRIIFGSVLNSLKPEVKREVATKWCRHLNYAKSVELNIKSYNLAVLVLGILGSESPDCLSPEESDLVANEILELLFNEQSPKIRIAAVELLGKGFSFWSSHINDSKDVINKLFKLSLVKEPQLLAKTAHQALLVIGARDPKNFLDAFDYIYKPNNEHRPELHSHALKTICSLLKKNPTELFPCFSILIDCVIRSLDPNISNLRDKCVRAATSLVQEMVRVYPIISFHQHTQKLAVAIGNIIIIYDLLSATKWCTLDGHTNTVTAISFSEVGTRLASYSIVDSKFKIWKQNTTFWRFLGNQLTHEKTLDIPDKYDRNITPQILLEAVKIRPKNESFLLIRTWGDDITID